VNRAWLTLPLGACALALATAAPAGAAAPVGSLTQLKGKAGCVNGPRADRCRKARGLGGDVSYLALPSDGDQLYASGRGVVVFKRGSRAGALRQLRGPKGCVSFDGRSHRGGKRARCRRARGLRTPADIVVSADGRNVYVAAFGDDAVVAFRRNSHTGTLKQLSGAGGCVSRGGKHGCAPGRALSAPLALALSDDGKSLYVAALDSNAVAILRREPSTGELSQPSGTAGCVGGAVSAGCVQARALEEPGDLELGGDSLYVASSSGASLSLADRGSLTVFSRDRSTGALTQLPGKAGCVAESVRDGCATARAISAIESVAVNQLSTYVLSFSADRGEGFFFSQLAAFARGPVDGAVSQLAGTDGCNGGTGCAPGRSLAGAGQLALSSDGASLYSASDAGLAIFSRSGSGGLEQLAGKRGCLQERGSGFADGCRLVRGLSSPRTVAISPLGGNVYTGSLAGIAAFKRKR
jgi:DNA-binding beta-propeller fold protein YncE